MRRLSWSLLRSSRGRSWLLYFAVGAVAVVFGLALGVLRLMGFENHVLSTAVILVGAACGLLAWTALERRMLALGSQAHVAFVVPRPETVGNLSLLVMIPVAAAVVVVTVVEPRAAVSRQSYQFVAYTGF